jgi:hypothetical protein
VSKLDEKTRQMNLLEEEFNEKTKQIKTHHENLLDEIRLELTEKNTEVSFPLIFVTYGFYEKNHNFGNILIIFTVFTNVMSRT